MPEKSNVRIWLLGVLRFLTLCGFTLWLGGLAFFGPIAAPVLFRVSRAYDIERAAPEMVSIMLSRFGFVMLACGFLILIGWAAERWLNRHLSTLDVSWSRRLWWTQGICSAAMTVIAVYLTQTLMPQIVAMQPEVLAATVSPTAQAAFDVLHDRYSQLASVIVWLGLAALFSLACRTALEGYSPLMPGE